MERYEAYKDSGIEWIGEMPEEWDCGKTKYHLAFVNGRAYKQEELLDEGEYRVLRVGNFNTNTNWYYSNLELDEKQYCVKGDLLYLWATTFGPQYWDGEKVIFHYHIWKILFHGAITKRFAYYALAAQASWQELQSHGSTMVHVTKEGMEQSSLPIPSVDEQQAIADYLDAKTAEIDALVADCEREVGLLQEYRKAVISEAVTKGLDAHAPMKDSGVEWIGEIPEGWKTLRIKDLCSYWNGLTYSPDDIVESGRLVLRSSNIRDGKLVYEDCVYVKEQVPEKAKARVGDVLICSRNGSRQLIGKNALIERDGDAFGAFMMIARPSCESRYFYYLLNSGVFEYYLPTYLTSTVNQLTGGNFGQMYVPFTSDIEEQLAIVKYLDAKTVEIDALIEAKQSMADKLREYRKSLISEAVTGKFKVPTSSTTETEA